MKEQHTISSQKGTFQAQQLLASIIPVTSVLLVGAYGSQVVRPDNVILFTSIFLLAAVSTFIGEKRVITALQSNQNEQCLELTTVCHEFLAGNRKVKAKVRGHNELSKLAEAINLLLDQQRHLLQQATSNPPPQRAPSTPRPRTTPQPQNNEAELLKKHLTQIINDLAPISKGDLRVRVSTSDNLAGLIADTCNSLIEELAQFVKWTRYASQVVTTASQSILDHSIEMTKNTENQMHLLSSMTNHTEKIVAFIQHLSNILHLNVDASKEIRRSIQEKIQHTDQATDTSLLQLLNELQRQTELLEDVLTSAEETSRLAESLVGNLYTVAQQIYQSSMGALKTVERLSKLETLAEGWHSTTNVFLVEENEDTNVMKEPWLL